jgi:DNA repair exonuclease SbcCD ATPase subunit
MIKSLIEDIDNMGVTGYAQKFVLAGLKFTDVDGKLCYLEVEHKKPVDVLATLFDEEEESIEEQSKEISEKGLSALDALLSFDDEEEEEAEEEEEEAEEDQDQEDTNDAPEQSHSEYLQDMFKKMNEDKERELKNRIEEKLKDIKKADMDISMAEKKKAEGTEQLRVLESRLESLKPQEEPNGIVFHVSEEIKPETGLDESTRHVADKIADLLNLKKDVLFAQLTEGYYVIKMIKANKNSFQVRVKQKTAAVMMPGNAAGTTISQMTRALCAPSTMADSSISRGTASMKPFIIQTA